MKIYAVRLFKNNRWNIIKTYESLESAVDFADNSFFGVEYDVKEMELSEVLEIEKKEAMGLR